MNQLSDRGIAQLEDPCHLLNGIEPKGLRNARTDIALILHGVFSHLFSLRETLLDGYFFIATSSWSSISTSSNSPALTSTVFSTAFHPTASTTNFSFPGPKSQLANVSRRAPVNLRKSSSLFPSSPR